MENTRDKKGVRDVRTNGMLTNSWLVIPICATDLSLPRGCAFWWNDGCGADRPQIDLQEGVAHVEVVLMGRKIQYTDLLPRQQLSTLSCLPP
eukprot:scaffold1501_cov158-Amphora_coffeaeformis.AAC.6